MKVFIVGGDYLVKDMFRSKGHEVQTLLGKDTELLVFTGGADVSPFLYGERPLGCTSFDINRDTQDIYFWKNVPTNLPKIGICRGAQFGNVMSGGKLWQDVNNHAGNTHIVRDLFSKNKQGQYKTYWVSSTHHQQAILSDQAFLLAAANLSDRRTGYRFYEKNSSDWKDVEAFYYPNTNFLGVQFHPEFSKPAECSTYFWELADTWLTTKKEPTVEPTRKSILL